MARNPLSPIAARGILRIACAAPVAFAAPALAADILPVAIAIAPTAPAAPCNAVSAPAVPQIGLVPAAPSSKASAILGGERSALEAMRAQQAALDDFGPLIAPAGKLEPAMAPLPVTACPRTNADPAIGLAATALSLPVGTRRAGPEDFLGSRRIAISKTFFDTQWRRVSREGAPGLRRHDLPMVAGDIDAKLATVNRWVNHAITYTEDSVLFGKADHWAGARKTLALGRGDCEDYALTKMQLLAAAGVRREDMYLTIAKDLVRRADHAVLVVRTPGGFRMLDNATDTVLDASRAQDYRPVLSYSADRAWIHGFAS